MSCGALSGRIVFGHRLLRGQIKLRFRIIYASFNFDPFKNIVAWHNVPDVVREGRRLLIRRLGGSNNTRRHVNLLQFPSHVALLIQTLAFLNLFDDVLDGHAFVVAQGVAAEHLGIIFLLFLEKMLFVNCLKFVPKHQEIVQMQIRNLEFRFVRHRHKHFVEA